MKITKVAVVDESEIRYEFEKHSGWCSHRDSVTNLNQYLISRPEDTLQHEQDFMYYAYPDNHDHVTKDIGSLTKYKGTPWPGYKHVTVYEVSVGEMLRWLILNGFVADEGEGEYLVKS